MIWHSAHMLCRAYSCLGRHNRPLGRKSTVVVAFNFHRLRNQKLLISTPHLEDAIVTVAVYRVESQLSVPTYCKHPRTEKYGTLL